MGNPAVSGTLEYWVTDRINMRVIRPISVHIGAFEGWITDRIPYPEYQAQFTYQTMSGNLAPTGALLKQTQKILVGGLSPAGALLKQAQKVLVGSLAPTGALIKQCQKVLVGVLAPIGVLIATYIPGIINEVFKVMWSGICKRMRIH